MKDARLSVFSHMHSINKHLLSTYYDQDSSWCWDTAKCAASGGYDFAADLHSGVGSEGGAQGNVGLALFCFALSVGHQGRLSQASEVGVEAQRGHGSQEGASRCAEVRRRGDTPPSHRQAFTWPACPDTGPHHYSGVGGSRECLLSKEGVSKIASLLLFAEGEGCGRWHSGDPRGQSLLPPVAPPRKFTQTPTHDPTGPPGVDWGGLALIFQGQEGAFTSRGEASPNESTA